MMTFWRIFFTTALTVILAAGCITGDDGDDGSDSGGTDTAAMFSENMENLYLAYISSRDSLTAATTAKLATIYTTFRVQKSTTNQNFISSVTDVLSSSSTAGGVVLKAAEGIEIQAILNAGEALSEEGAGEKDAAIEAANDALADLESQRDAQDDALRESAESALESVPDDGSSIYDAVGDIINGDGGSDGGSDGASIGEVCADTFGGGDSGNTLGLEDISSKIEDYYSSDEPARDNAANDALDALKDYLDQPFPESETDVRSIEDILNEYLDGDASEAETLDLIKELLHIGGGDGILPPGTHQITLDIDYTETMTITTSGLFTSSEDNTFGTITFPVTIPLGATDVDFGADGTLTYRGNGTDSVTGTTWINSGTAAIIATGGIYINDQGTAIIMIGLVFTYSFMNTTAHPFLGEISVPGDRSQFSDTIEMEFKNGEVYSDFQTYPMNTLAKQIELTLGD